MSLQEIFNELARHNWKRETWGPGNLVTMWHDYDQRRPDAVKIMHQGNERIRELLTVMGGRKDKDFYEGCAARFEDGFWGRCDIPFITILNPEWEKQIEDAREKYLNDNEIREDNLSDKQKEAVRLLAAFQWSKQNSTHEFYIQRARGECHGFVQQVISDGQAAEKILIDAGFEIGEHFYFANMFRASKGSCVSSLHISPVYEWFGHMIMAAKKSHPSPHTP